jgi:hypothetical protein
VRDHLRSAVCEKFWRGLRGGDGSSPACGALRPVPVLVPVDGWMRSKRIEEDRSDESAQISENARKACSVVGLLRRLDGTLNQRVAGSIPARA